MMNTTTAVLLATSRAPLLSGQLNQCFNASDPSCNGGVAAFRAMLRHYSKLEAKDTRDDALPFAHIQLLDKDSAFVHMHPLGLSVNRFILNGVMGLDVFASSPSILLQNKLDYEVSSQDISSLQTHDMPLLLSNVGVPPSNSWYPYTKAVHFDTETRLAILSLSMSTEALVVPQIPSALGILRYVRKVNEENGCVMSPLSYHTTFSDFFLNSNVTEKVVVDEMSPSKCWLPVVQHSDKGGDQFVSFLKAMLQLPRKHKPAMIVDTEGSVKEYEEPTLIEGIWVVSLKLNSDTYFQHKLGMSYDTIYGLQLDNVEFISAPLSPLPDEMKDEIYRSEIIMLRRAADEAMINNPVVGYSDEMPFARDLTSYRPCKSGECPIGNLFTDAARWYADADVAFITSGGVRGPGWQDGEVHVSNIWESLPFPNNLCTGRINGVHLFQLLNYSMSVATFEGKNTDDGRLLQLSGLRVTYNTKLSTSRILSIDVLDRESGEFKPIDRLQLYKFATDSYLCGGYEPFPSLLGRNNLVVAGEQPGTIIEGKLYQEMLAEFLNATTSTDAPYNTTVQNRLVNDTAATEVLNLVQTEKSCVPGEYWEDAIQTCLSCPVDFDVTFSKELLEFKATDQSRVESITLTNNEDFDVAIIRKIIPDWLVLDSVQSAGSNTPTILGAGESLNFSIGTLPSELEEGTVYVTIAFGVLDGGDYHGCVGSDASFDIKMHVLPTTQLNQLGVIRAAGFTLFGIIAITSISCAGFVVCHQQQHVVKALQPIFLLCICCGVLIMGSSMVPLSIDDEIASKRGCDISCMALPWLISLGFSVAISALFAKLWRINMIISASSSCRRVQVRVQDVAMPLIVLLIVNITILLCWTLIDPLMYKRFEMDGASWSTYGRCVGSSNASNTFLIILCVLNVVVLFLALFQAWKARNISDEFSETKIVGGALYGWLQLLIVGVPVALLISDDNTTARYFLFVALIFLVLIIQTRRAQVSQKVHARSNNEIGSLQYRTWSRTLGRQRGGAMEKGRRVQMVKLLLRCLLYKQNAQTLSQQGFRL